MTGSCFSVCRGASELYCSAPSLCYHVFVILEHEIFCKCEKVPFFLLSVVPLWAFFRHKQDMEMLQNQNIYFGSVFPASDPDLDVMQNTDLIRCLLFPLVDDLYIWKSGNMRKSASNCVTWPLVLKGTVSREFFFLCSSLTPCAELFNLIYAWWLHVLFFFSHFYFHTKGIPMMTMALTQFLAFLHTKGYHERTTFNIFYTKGLHEQATFNGFVPKDTWTFDGTEGINHKCDGAGLVRIVSSFDFFRNSRR